MNATLHQFRAVVALAEQLHCGRAAARLGTAQPHLSTLIRHVESAGVLPLFPTFIRPARPRNAVDLVEAGDRPVRRAPEQQVSPPVAAGTRQAVTARAAGGG